MLELIIPSFIAGLLTFLAPCTLPLVPAYLTFISGSSIRNISGNKIDSNRSKVFMNGLFFVLGFSLVFILLGLFAGALGGLFMEGKVWLSRIGGILVIFFGFLMLEILPTPTFLSDKKLNLHIDTEKRGTYGFSFLLGVIFGSGWTPCIGPILGSILVIASTSSTALSGALLLSVFSLGLGIPFLLIAIGVSKAEKIISKNIEKLWFVSKVGGLLLIILGFMLLTGKLNVFTEEVFEFLHFINYESLMNYL
ncbi:MAG TPA: cytochrome c biogenesis protein CcdA [Parcubacteria group bacterium]|jgi:cytochrome c-type biogenesis protein|nr:cytochrome c biogenesis protein CcdA [Parcubacteria group bacterium]